ncbi:hypothetical protein ASZ78_005140 [Callipepla squamata]|uniref:RRM domain-containing protein n=1 Tax=Callipepla squamata TaxID=9009 RepID=A0A226MJX8_CALSU|nr:hypothetical protein ASZ78_005140 [Callipepla squamata]
MAMQAAKRANIRLPPEVNRILYIRNLPYKITAEEMYDIFGKYGPIRQIRVLHSASLCTETEVGNESTMCITSVLQGIDVIMAKKIKLYPKSKCCSDEKWGLRTNGNTPETRGTAYVVYEDIFDAKNACDHLSGFNVCNRYLVVLYYNANRGSLSYDNRSPVLHFKHSAPVGPELSFDITAKQKTKSATQMLEQKVDIFHKGFLKWTYSFSGWRRGYACAAFSWS